MLTEPGTVNRDGSSSSCSTGSVRLRLLPHHCHTVTAYRRC